MAGVVRHSCEGAWMPPYPATRTSGQAHEGGGVGEMGAVGNAGHSQRSVVAVCPRTSWARYVRDRNPITHRQAGRIGRTHRDGYSRATLTGGTDRIASPGAD